MTPPNRANQVPYISAPRVKLNSLEDENNCTELAGFVAVESFPKLASFNWPLVIIIAVMKRQLMNLTTPLYTNATRIVWLHHWNRRDRPTTVRYVIADSSTAHGLSTLSLVTNRLPATNDLSAEDTKCRLLLTTIASKTNLNLSQ